MQKIFFFIIFSYIFISQTFAQKDPLTGYTFWNVNVKATRTVTIETQRREKTECSSDMEKGSTTFSMSANMSSGQFPGKFNSSGNFQLFSDMAPEIKVYASPISGSGTANLQATNTKTLKMNQCGDSPCTEISTTNMNGNVIMNPDKSNFSFDYTKENGMAFANFAFGFDDSQVSAGGNASTNGCNNNGGGDLGELAKITTGAIAQAYSQFAVGNMPNEFVQKAAEEIGVGYLATITPLPNQKGFIVGFNFSKTLTKGEGDNKEVTMINSTLNMSITKQGDESPYEAIIEPFDGQEKYEKFIPEGRPIPLENKTYGNSIKFYTYIIDKKTKEKVNVKCQTTYTLQSVSHEPGVCNNAPMKVAADKEPDYKFTDMMGAYASITDTKVVTQKNKGETPIIVTSYDYGGTAELHAEVTLEDGTPVPVKRKDRKLDYLNLPFDENNNDIADQWEINKEIKGNNYPPNWDEENDIKLQKAGDGLTLYEEYRGFAVRNSSNDAKIFKRFSPKNLEVCFFLDGEHKDWARASYQKMQEISGIQFIEIQSNNDLEVIERSQYPRQVNFNSETHQLDKMCAIFTKLCDEKRINTKPLDGIPDEKSVCPNEVDLLHIGLKDGSAVYSYFDDGLPPAKSLEQVSFAWTNAAKLLNEVLHENIDLTKVNALAQAGKDELYKQYVTFAIVHELGHAIGCQHHVLEAYLKDDDNNKGLVEFKNMWQTIERINNNSALSQTEKESQVKSEYRLYGYKEVNSFDYFEQGDINCPMRYWFASHTHLEILSFIAGNWKPFETSPIVKKKWEFCDYNWQQIHLK